MADNATNTTSTPTTQATATQAQSPQEPKPKESWQIEADQRTKDLTDKLEAGMNELFSSDKYTEYLKTMSKFHNYSSRNIMLIKQQMPNATKIAGFKAWKENFNRQVKKGEASLRIFAPIGKKEPEIKLMEKIDPETGKPMLSKDGNVIMEEMTALTSNIRFKLVPVFDVSQTYGEPLPQLAEDLTGNVAHYEAFLDTLKSVSPLPIVFEEMPENKDGYCRFGEKIGIREGMSEIQTVSAIVHEITHAKLHDKNNHLPNDKPMPDVKPKSKEVKEIEAESISYVVCQKYGIETGDNSFGYLASWGSHDMKEIKASLDTIRKEANTIINEIEYKFASICKERGIDLSQSEQTEEQAPPQAAPSAKEPTVQAQAQSTTKEPIFTTETRTENIAGVDFSFSEVKPSTHENTLEHQNFQKLAELFPEVISKEFYYMRLEAGEAMMPLSLEWIGEDRLSIMHTHIQNGDLMYDPMIVMEVDREAKTATAVEFEQSNPPLYQRIEDGVGMSIDGNGNEKTINGLQGQINDFASMWFDNIGKQGYMREHGALLDGKDADVNVHYNSDQKPYNLAFKYELDGTTVYNRMDRTEPTSHAPEGYMNRVAYVDSYRDVTFFEDKDKLPPAVVSVVENVKLTNEKEKPAEVTKPEPKQAEPTFSEDVQEAAKELPPDIELGSGPDEKGVSVWDWNNTQDKNGNERFIAHINFDREITYFTDNLPANIKSDIEDISKGDWKEMFAIEMAGMDYDPPLPPQGIQLNDSPPVPTAPAEILPDPTIGIAEQHEYGYTSVELLPLNQDRAVELFNQDMTVFLLYPDNTEAMAFDVDEIRAFDGIFGIEREDWLNSKEYKALAAQSVNESEQVADTPQQIPSQTPPPAETAANGGKQPPPSEPTAEAVEKPPETPKNEIPIYKESLSYARDNGELDTFRQNKRLNVECGEAIDKAIRENSTPAKYGQYVDSMQAAKDVIAEYGAERVALVLASNINYHDWDGRLSNTNKAWAKEFDTPDPDVYLQTHLSILDGFSNRFREAVKEIENTPQTQATDQTADKSERTDTPDKAEKSGKADISDKKSSKEKPSLMDTLKAGEEKSKREFGNVQKPGMDAPTKSAKNKTGEEL